MPAALVSLADMELTDSAQGSNPWQRRDAFGQADVAFDPLRELLARRRDQRRKGAGAKRAKDCHSIPV